MAITVTPSGAAAGRRGRRRARSVLGSGQMGEASGAAFGGGVEVLTPGSQLPRRDLELAGRVRVVTGRDVVEIVELYRADAALGVREREGTFAFLRRLAAVIVEAAPRGEVAAATAPVLAAQSAFALYFFSLQTWLSGFTTVETAIDPHLRSAPELLMSGLVPR